MKLRGDRTETPDSTIVTEGVCYFGSDCKGVYFVKGSSQVLRHASNQRMERNFLPIQRGEEKLCPVMERKEDSRVIVHTYLFLTVY